VIPAEKFVDLVAEIFRIEDEMAIAPDLEPDLDFLDSDDLEFLV
jgi:hypothetical protein